MRRSIPALLAFVAWLSAPAVAGAQDASIVSDQQTVRISPEDRVKTLTAVKGELDTFMVRFKAASAGLLGPVVTGAPYSATTTTEKIQALADGNRIVNRTIYNTYRDGQGRVRREEVGENGAVTSVMIMDPVTNVTYVLDPDNRTARKLALTRQNFVFSTNREARDTAITVMSETIAGEMRTKVATEKGLVDGGSTVVSVAPVNLKREALGTQVMEGVPVEGTRTVSRIPAGQIGTERPIDTVTEQWYSKDLQMTIVSRHSDPRAGETNYRVSNLRRGEPDPTMFQVPGDYRIEETVKTVQPLKVVK